MAKRLAMAAMNEEEAAAAAEAVDTRLRRWRRLECDRLVLVAYVIRSGVLCTFVDHSSRARGKQSIVAAQASMDGWVDPQMGSLSGQIP
eukprot:scaffold96749_cov21-Tisochrysis_lutea.AAC.2